MPRRRAIPSTEFESLAFAVEPRSGQRADQAARQAVRAAFHRERWRLVPLSIADYEFLARPPAREGQRRALSQAQAWTHAYRLRDQPQVVYAEPLFTILDEQQHRAGLNTRGERSAGTDLDPRTEGRHEWPLEKMHVKQAWALFGARTPGRAVRIGHPDTGYTPHPEIAGARLRADLGYDYEDDDRDSRDRLASGPLRNPGHGTGTASLIVSSRGKPARWPDPDFVSGIAPGASLVPIRTTRSVVLWSMERLVRAIHHAVACSCHVISISLGGVVPSTALHHAVQMAELEGVIVLCAAGNQVRFVVFPAAFDEVVAVAASGIDDVPWAGSCRGPAVDITAPGHSIYRARTDRVGGRERYTVERGSGTSFSAAATAGIAALWLSYHGRSRLVARYGKDRVASVFKQLLQKTCRQPSGWDTGAFGRGLIHAGRLLSAALPASAPARGLRGLQRRPVSIDELPLEAVVHLLAPAPRSGVERALADLLRVDQEALPAVMQKIGAEIAFRIGTNVRLREVLVTASMGWGAVRGRHDLRTGRAVAAIRRTLRQASSRQLEAALRMPRPRR